MTHGTSAVILCQINDTYSEFQLPARPFSRSIGDLNPVNELQSLGCQCSIVSRTKSLAIQQNGTIGAELAVFIIVALNNCQQDTDSQSKKYAHGVNSVRYI